MSAFAKLKKNKGSSIAELKKSIEDSNGDSGFEDLNEWKLTRGKDGSGYAVIRFLPQPDGEDVPYIKRFTHAFQHPKTQKWFIENSLTTIGKDCPISEHNSLLWNTGIKEKQDVVRQRKRKTNYYSNIYVVSDPSNPENNGKVFRFRYGIKIFNMIDACVNPQFPDEKAYSPFDMWEGANFKLKARLSDNQVNYDSSAFDAKSPMFEDEDDPRYEEVYTSMYSLLDIINEDKFLSYAELKDKFDKYVVAHDVGSIAEVSTAIHTNAIIDKQQEAMSGSIAETEEKDAIEDVEVKSDGDFSEYDNLLT